MVADLDGLRAENRESWGQRNNFDDIYAYYQDSDDADSPISSESDNASLSNKGVELEVGLKFIDKEQLREAVEDYRIMKGYDIRITHSDKKRFQAFCNTEGCEGWWHASREENGMYSVTHGSEGFVVDIVETICTCNAWTLSGIPCHHALAVMRDENMEPTQFIHKCYSTTMRKKTYAYILKPMNGPSLWSPCEDQPIVAPVSKQRKKGNYQFKRRSEEGERRPKSQYGVISCSGGTVKCSLRKQYGHNKKTCRQRDSSTCAQSAFAGPETASATVTNVGATSGYTISVVSANASTIDAANGPILTFNYP
ncbi:hypothetical protein Cgig2_024560 [Carnegiea gigantea]|uniref:SWIM-type domain-containing protein n=1 Tax=Carnegiea gigantea TaxID=171969 RepID=A0A9Q1GZK8_9CARY|nr:hypothetical protein Cgig2_024560 [Carnegiea gigantea]